MEVHHHPEPGKKTFKEYLLEGLMIFLAVTMGFLAESLREYITDKEKERQYVSSLINDIKQDSANLAGAIEENKRKLKGLNVVLSLSKRNLDEPANRKLLYENAGNSISYYSSFSSNDATMMQLKNAGGLRLIRRSHVADSIARYDIEIRGIAGAEKPYGKSIEDALESLQQILDFTAIDDSSYYRQGHFTDKKLPILWTDSLHLKMFYNRVSVERGWTENYLRNMESRLPFVCRMISFLQKQYDID